MAKKKGGFGRFIGALTGTPYECLLKQVDKLTSEHQDDDIKLARTLKKLVNIVGENFEQENIDEEEGWTGSPLQLYERGITENIP